MHRLPIRTLLLALALAFSPAAHAQRVAPPPEQPGEEQAAPAETTADLRQTIESAQAALNERTDLTEERRKELEAIYAEAIAALDAVIEANTRTAQYRERIETAPERLEGIKAQLNVAPTPATLDDIPDSATVADLERLEDEAKVRLQTARAEATRLRTEADRRLSRGPALTEQIATARDALADLDQQLALPPPADTPSELITARRLRLEAQRRAAAANLTALETERERYTVGENVLPQERTLANRRVTEIEQRLEAIQDRLNKARRERSDQAAREARRIQQSIEQLSKEVEELAVASTRVSELATLGRTVSDQLDQTNRDITSVRAEAEEIRRSFASVEDRLDKAGLSRAVGLVLRRQLAQLPDQSSLERTLDQARRDLAAAEYQRVLIDEEYERYLDVERRLQRVMNELPDDLDPGVRVNIEDVGRRAFEAHREALADIRSDYNDLSEDLSTLIESRERLTSYASLYLQFIEERIVWMPSVAGRLIPSVRGVASGLTWFIVAPDWPVAWSNVRRHALDLGNGTLLIGAMTLLLFALYPRCKKQIRESGVPVKRFATDRIRYTIQAAFFTLAAALPVPVLLWFLGRTLSLPPDQPAVALAVAGGLKRAAFILFILQLAHQVVRPGGLADAHFRWPNDALRHTRKHLRWFTPVAGVFAFLIFADHQRADPDYDDSLGRVMFIVAMLVVAFFLRLVLRPSGPVTRSLIESARAGWIKRFYRILPFLVVLLPIACAVLAATGYYYTAHVFERRLLETAFAALLIAMGNAMLLRWLFVARRKLAVERAAERRAALLKAQEHSGDASVDGVSLPDEDVLDIPAIDAQSRQIISAAVLISLAVVIAGIWADQLPALKAADRVVLYPHVQIIGAAEDDAYESLRATPAAPPPSADTTPAAPANQNDQAARPSSATPSPTGPIPLPGVSSDNAGQSDQAASQKQFTITLGDVGRALIFVLLTIIATRNLPGLLEITLLKRLPIDTGSRYAIATTARYTVLIVGISLAFLSLGISWSSVQWLAAALTFGLAFGLQEIFANFVSGLIILAERPIRVGDTVTVGNVTGTVTRIRMRAATIIDWDRKELIVPNKTIITEQIVNWSLTDPILRIIVPVGIAYGSDTEKAKELMLKVAHENQTVLDDPPPRAVFLGFGDSSLNFDVRVFIPNIDCFLQTRDEILSGIDQEFRKAKIEISFPQRDLHVRSIGPLADAIAQRTVSPVERDA